MAAIALSLVVNSWITPLRVLATTFRLWQPTVNRQINLTNNSIVDVDALYPAAIFAFSLINLDEVYELVEQGCGEPFDVQALADQSDEITQIVLLVGECGKLLSQFRHLSIECVLLLLVLCCQLGYPVFRNLT